VGELAASEACGATAADRSLMPVELEISACPASTDYTHARIKKHKGLPLEALVGDKGRRTLQYMQAELLQNKA
jgi:hypothetical protein